MSDSGLYLSRCRDEARYANCGRVGIFSWRFCPMETRLPVWPWTQCQGHAKIESLHQGLINKRAGLGVQKRGKHKYCAEESGEFPVHDCQREIRNNLVYSVKLDKPLHLNLGLFNVCPYGPYHIVSFTSLVCHLLARETESFLIANWINLF